MVQLSLVFVAAALVFVQGSPLLNKRIAQEIDKSLVNWQAACRQESNGSLQCNALAVKAFENLLAGADPCGQQDAADSLIDFAKQQKDGSQMITLAQIFAQQPRNSPNSVSIPYCQKAPKNAELIGLFQCQWIGDNQKVFVNGVTVGQFGTIPFGKTSAVSPPGSCPAHPGGPIPDGTQLVDITVKPFGGSDSSPAPAPTPDVNAIETTNDNRLASSSTTTTPPSAGNFQQGNGEDAQKLNRQFASLTPNSPCNDGENACVGGKFGQCVNGNFVLTSCAANLECFALPLVNKRGTTITCTTQEDAQQRIKNSGANGSLTG